MRKIRDRKQVTLDVEHMRRLHQEAIEQLELMRTALETAEHAIGTMRDTLEEIALDHWNGYLDVMHAISAHDTAMATVLGKLEIKLRDSESLELPNQQQFSNNPQLLLLLLRALTRRHRRFWDIYGWRGNPMSEYIRESMTVEREHMTELIAMIQNTI